MNTGFSRLEDPGSPLPSNTPLRPGAVYHFWLEVGELLAGTIEATPVQLLEIEELPPESRLKVVLFPVAGGPDRPRAPSEGELSIAPDGSVVVSAQPPFGVNLDDDSELLRRRLFFLAETSKAEGTMQLRCSIYHKQVLLQSRLITARVSELEAIDGALTSELDFTLAPRLDPRHLDRIPEYKLSLLLNQAEDGTHSLTVKGERFSDAASFDPVELQTLVERGRRALRKAAWGSDEPWHEGLAYRYTEPTREKLQADLVSLAIWGIRFYAAVCDRLMGEKSLEEFEAGLLTPGYVQLAVKQSPRHLLPVALLYDYIGLRDTARPEDYELCPSFLEALDAGTSLEQVPCFQGQCPSRGSGTTVCPSGFWGYRHALGIPVTLAGAPDVPTAITYAGEPSFSVAVCTDPAFTLRQAHEAALRQISPDLHYAASRADALTLLKEGGTHVVYFYCHGGLEQDVPFIKVGPLTEEAITSVTLLNERIRWEEPRPLVFLNGCHTVGLEPEQALEFVSALVRRAQAAGVVGTEITVFEPLARAFAEDCLQRFLGGTSLGWAVREARLTLLEAGNPLGLVYLPYALPSLELVPR